MPVSSMADIGGTGEFVHKNEWTCSKHERPMRHECDCSECDREWDCDECSTAKWTPAFNEDGSPLMYELSVVDKYFAQMLTEEVKRSSLFLDMLKREDVAVAKIEWAEDNG